jgi:hypothetical protein
MIMFYYAWNIPTGAGFNPSILITKFFSSDYLSLDIQRRSSHWEKLTCFSESQVLLLIQLLVVMEFGFHVCTFK